MTGRERVQRALRFERVDRAPRDLWCLPGVHATRRAELEAVLARFPMDIGHPEYRYGTGRRASGKPYVRGTWVDEWGSVWHAAEDGVAGEVREPPLADWSALTTYELPYELLREADLSQVDEGCARSDRFMLAGTLIRPFERLQFLCGTEKVLADLAYGTPELYELSARLHAFSLEELKLWCRTTVDGISFMDDWGSQQGLLISPQMWRAVFKPLYAEYCELIHRAGKRVFFHSDGHIAAIIPDLIEIGVDALNCQLFCMDIEGLAQAYRGHITFWGELDRQWTLPFGTPEDVRRDVLRVRRALDRGSGGVIAECEWGNDTPMENIMAAFAAWEEPLP
ncbi:MAG: uroporphyrinogen decarboxylase family protein [Anaerolineae bacterium]